MERSTILALNAINRAFYAACAADFDVTRASAWHGWEIMLPHVNVPEDRPLAVLDVGCGNGRLGTFLARRLQTPIHYHGIDSSEELLDTARAALTGIDTLTAVLESGDIVEGELPVGGYDLVAAMGVLHHIPGCADRRAFVRVLAERVTVGGRLVWTEWRFAESPRFLAHALPLPPELAGDLEPGDYLLDWGGSEGAPPELARRYCHSMDDVESAALIAAAGLPLVAEYRADGHTGDTNQYVILAHR